MNSKKKSACLLQDTKCPSSSERKQFMTKNGSILQQKLIATFGARYKLPIRCFTAKEMFKVTNNFSQVVCRRFFLGSALFVLSKGCFQERPVLVAQVHRYYFPAPNRKRYYLSHPDEIIHNIVISSQMSHLKHVVKLVGCCLEFEFPVLVYEDTNVTVLDDSPYKGRNFTSFSWRKRIKIIKDIAYTMAYLHNAFPTPIIHQKLDLSSVFIDPSGTAKFLDFTYCLPLPPGKMQFQVSRIPGHRGFIDPEFQKTFSITAKTDVYSIGVLLLVLVTGREAMAETGDGAKPIHVAEYVKHCLMKDQLNQVVVPKIWESDDIDQNLEQLKALVELALRCTQEKGEDRPYMIDVAKELLQIEKM